MKKKKKHKFSSQKTAELVRRQAELDQYGKIVSLRPSLAHKDKTKYTRKEKHANNTPERSND